MVAGQIVDVMRASVTFTQRRETGFTHYTLTPDLAVITHIDHCLSTRLILCKSTKNFSDVVSVMNYVSETLTTINFL